ncbi:MAG: hypothetical protein ACK5JD_04945 [Mangrovibacterium sp.]
MRNSIHHIFEQFKLVESFREQFKARFANCFRPVLTDTFRIGASTELDEFMEWMADEAISFTEAIIDKDRNYSEFRIDEELKSMDTVLQRFSVLQVFHPGAFQIKFELNKLILSFYPALYELSGSGYRLLERNVNYFVFTFVRFILEEAAKPVQTLKPGSAPKRG